MNLHALIDPAEYKRQYPDVPGRDGPKPTGPLANKSISGRFKLKDSLSDESLAALYRVQLTFQRGN